MRKTLLVALCLSCGFFASAQYSVGRKPEAGQLPPGATYSPQLLSELGLLRDTALNDDYGYQQLAHLTENIGARRRGRYKLKLRSRTWLTSCASWDSKYIWKM